MRDYVIVAPPANTTSAGITGLYKLDRDLRARGMQSRVITPGDGLQPAPDDIVVYPDCFSGNMFGAKNVVRMLFMWAGYFGQDKDFPESEYMYYYVPDYILNGRNPDNILTIPMIDEERFPYKPLDERSGSCYLAIKYQDYFGNQVTGLPADCVRINKQMDIAQLFSEKKTLITFDNSAINTEAALAGMDVEYRYNPTFEKRYYWGKYWSYYDVPMSYALQKQLYRNTWLPQFIQRTQERFS